MPVLSALASRCINIIIIFYRTLTISLRDNPLRHIVAGGVNHTFNFVSTSVLPINSLQFLYIIADYDVHAPLPSYLYTNQHYMRGIRQERSSTLADFLGSGCTSGSLIRRCNQKGLTLPYRGGPHRLHCRRNP